ncbi:MAG: low molecular weight phosphotyrosine protein phosphatase [Brachybacterium sp.]|uniref:low molecular weight protein-tyrosine-phosphatase n=1 Tax=Brachybacterium sp. TaxID=1891286 RepID=UPI0026470771|nr:low molecular weight protein-tyrosine-phosphatase [Brachybacterium sp.]MDN5685720.1 low molecular weight phosphotyrosine protein phosphatase [Brachybacterium sp.]
MTYRILTVCTGNICRSPMAEYALRDALERAGLGEQVEVASVGTTREEIGNPIDPRAGALLRSHGLDPSAHRARQMSSRDLGDADLVLALDHDHVRPLHRAGGQEIIDRLHMVRDFAPGPVEDTGIRDPWWGDESNFELAWEQITEAAPGIIEHVRTALQREGRSGGRP